VESPFDVFLSYNRRNASAVREIYTILQDRGLRPWLDEEDLRAGGVWQDEIPKAIRTIPVAAILIGAEGPGAWQRPEAQLCLDRAMHDQMRVIPVLLPGAPADPEIPDFLRMHTWIDFRDGFLPREIRRFLYGITGRKPAEVSEEAPGLAPPPLHKLPFESLGDLVKGRVLSDNHPAVFVSYSHRDEEWKDLLVRHLKVLELEELLTVWDDRRIAAGGDTTQQPSSAPPGHGPSCRG
jgi:hypothetical protein